MKSFADMTKVELQDLLRKAGLPVSGNKPDLIKRLEHAKSSASTAAKSAATSARKTASRKSASRKTASRATAKSHAECPPGKIRNPATGRCINDPALKGGKKSAPRKSAARKSAVRKSPAGPNPCPPGKVRNPATGRCINDPALKKSAAKKSAARKSAPKKDCPPGKVRNPVNGRCYDPADGPQRTYYPGTKKIHEFFSLKGGVKNGMYVSSYETGRTKEDGRYTNGLKEGKWYGYYDSSHMTEGTTLSGVKYIGTYLHDVKDKIWQMYGPTGMPTHWEYWTGGKIEFSGTGAFGGGYGNAGGRNTHNQHKQQGVQGPCAECAEELIKHGLYPHASASKRLSPDDQKTLLKNFRKWAMTNHPDKGGDTKKFAVVSGCVDTFAKTSKC